MQENQCWRSVSGRSLYTWGRGVQTEMIGCTQSVEARADVAYCCETQAAGNVQKKAASKHEPTRDSGKLVSAADDVSVSNDIGSDDILYVVVGVVTDKAENLMDDVQRNSTTTDDATRSSG